jgi:hypothetical protein
MVLVWFHVLVEVMVTAELLLHTEMGEEQIEDKIKTLHPEVEV